MSYLFRVVPQQKRQVFSLVPERSCSRAWYSGNLDVQGPCKSQTPSKMQPRPEWSSSRERQWPTSTRLYCVPYCTPTCWLLLRPMCVYSTHHGGSTTLIQQTALWTWLCVTTEKPDLNLVYNAFRLLSCYTELQIIVCTLHCRLKRLFRPYWRPAFFYVRDSSEAELVVAAVIVSCIGDGFQNSPGRFQSGDATLLCSVKAEGRSIVLPVAAAALTSTLRRLETLIIIFEQTE